jgi:hypothetical protein
MGGTIAERFLVLMASTLEGIAGLVESQREHAKPERDQ